MNPVLEAIHQRRSLRSYHPKPVPKEVLLTLIQAANAAPSGMNIQPWRFVVVEDPALKKLLTETAIPNAKKYVETLRESHPERYKSILRRYDELVDPIYYSAAALIFVIGSGRFAVDSCPLACANIMLAAQFP